MFPARHSDRRPGGIGMRSNVESVRAWRTRVDGLQGGLAKPDEARRAGFPEEEIRREFGDKYDRR